ncbi:MAG TPA: response regulator [Spirochaetia bacterium]|nr:response regulator [Spirochaetia bacterium]
MAKNGKKVRIFSALEVANICGVVNQTAINWIKSNHLKAFTTPGGQYRIYAEDLVQFLGSRNMRIPEELIALTRESGKPAILIVDDDEELNNMLKEVFERRLEGYDIYQAFDGFEAGRALTEILPRVIILDIDLPGVNGHKLCGKIKDDPSIGNPIIIAVSGLDDPLEEERILTEGANAFIPKPIDFDKLIRTVHDFTGLRRI